MVDVGLWVNQMAALALLPGPLLGGPILPNLLFQGDVLPLTWSCPSSSGPGEPTFSGGVLKSLKGRGFVKHGGGDQGYLPKVSKPESPGTLYGTRDLTNVIKVWTLK